MVIYLIHNIFNTQTKLRLLFLLLLMLSMVVCCAQEIPLWKVHYDSTQLYWGKDWKKTIQHLKAAEQAALNDLGLYDANYLTIINDLGLAYWQSKEYARAESLLLKGYNLKREVLPTDDPELLRAMSNLAGLYAEANKLSAARHLYKKILKNFDSSSGDIYWKSAKSLLSMYETSAQLDSAWQFIKGLPVNQLNELQDQRIRWYEFKIIEGRLQRKMRHYDQAQDILLAIANDLSQRHDPLLSSRYIQSLQELGLTYLATGSFNKAEKNLLQAFRLTKAEHTSDKILLIEVLNSLASVYEKMSIYNKAVAYYNEALALCEQMDSQYLLQSCITLKSNLAGIQLKQGDLASAITNYEEILKNLSGNTHVTPAFTITVLNNLGSAYRKNAQYKQANAHLERALTLLSANQLNDDDLAAIVLNNLAVLLTVEGKFDQALIHYKKAYEIKKKIYGNQSVLLMDLASNMAVVLWALQKEEEAIPLFQQSIALAIRQIHYTFPNLNQDEQVQFYKKLKDDFERFNSIAIQYGSQRPALLKQVFNHQIIIKSLLFFTQQHRQDLIYNQKDSTLIKSYELLKEKREQLGLFYQLSVQEMRQSGISATTLEQEIDVLDKNISLKTSETVAEKMLAKAAQWPELQTSLKEDEALVEIIRIRKYDFKRRQESAGDRINFGFTDSTYYAVLITTKQTLDAPHLVLMKNGFDMERRLLNYYRNTLRFSVVDEHSYESYWHPFDHLIHDKSKIYLSGDGVYYKINLNILRNPADGKYIVQRYNLHYLLNPAQYLEKARTSFSNQQAVLMGDPLFDMDLPKVQTTRNEQEGFSALPGAQREIRKVEELLKSKGWRTNTFFKNTATEKNLKNIRSPSILHIATHGFFSTSVVPLAQDAKKDFLFQSGLILAGANKNLNEAAEAVHDDGILTAYEVMNLDLAKTDLVILSACETGLGKVENGEGVYGLQRSFLQAGARDIVISLWKVDDLYTQELMIKFYQYLLEGQSKGDALKAAQLSLLQTVRDPLYWGGFILVGAD